MAEFLINTVGHKRWIIGPGYLYDSIIHGDHSTHRVLRQLDQSVVEEKRFRLDDPKWKEKVMAHQAEMTRIYRQSSVPTRNKDLRYGY